MINLMATEHFLQAEVYSIATLNKILIWSSNQLFNYFLANQLFLFDPQTQYHLIPTESKHITKTFIIN